MKRVAGLGASGGSLGGVRVGLDRFEQVWSYPNQTLLKKSSNGFNLIWSKTKMDVQMLTFLGQPD